MLLKNSVGKGSTMARYSPINKTVARILVVGFALLVGVTGVEPVASECPKNVRRNETVQIPHESDCTKYYTCLGSSKVLRDCPLMDGEGNRLFFNAELQQCDWPWDSGCDLPFPIRSIEEKSLQVKPRATECPEVDSEFEAVFLAHEWDCSKFYRCFEGHKFLMSCPSVENDQKLYFNSKKQICDLPQNVDCKLPGLTLKNGLFSCDHPTRCPRHDSQNETVHLADEHDCTKFYKCLQGMKIPMSCPADQDGNKLYFNPCQQVCDWPYNVDCDARRLSLKKKKSVSCDPPTQCPRTDSKDETVHLADWQDCTKFYKCLQGKKISMSCPEDEQGNKLFFNACEQVCDWPWNVDCQ